MINTDNLISVIVPVYNVEATLERCLDSILAQAEVELEVILVDDGSNDSCGQICESYAKDYSQIVLIRQANGGLSAARNSGLAVARGRYVAFIDSDDYVLPGMFSNLLCTAKEFDADICCCGYTKVRDGVPEEYSLVDERCMVTPFKYLQDTLFAPLAGYVWNRLYKRELIGSLRFVKSSAEDLLFNCSLWTSIQKVAYAPGCPYCYVFRSDSLSNSAYAGIKGRNWTHDEISKDVKKILPDQDNINELLRARDAQNALNELLFISGLHEYDWIRPRLLSMVRDNYESYCRFEQSTIKRLAYKVLPALPPALLGFLSKVAGIRR